MSHGLISAILGGIRNVGFVLLLAPFCQGVLRKVTARVQSRQGPPIWQPYFDLLKLLGKEDIESGESPGMQRFAAYLSLAAVLTVAWMVPMGFGAPMNEAGDAILLIYLLTLCGICTLLAGLASGSTYSLVGISRAVLRYHNPGCDLILPVKNHRPRQSQSGSAALGQLRRC
jgi:formate hydrogenlyase subunit 4